MSLWSRFANLFRSAGLRREIDEELQSHLEEAIEQGRDPAEAKRAFGSALRYREESRDAQLIEWLDSLRADAVFGWRQIRKKKATSTAAILSMALGIGACMSAFRLIDAMLLRPLPIRGADRLYLIAREGIGPNGSLRVSESSEYPLFRRMRIAAKDEAELIAISYSERADLTYGSDEEMEKATRQYVSGWMFNTFGLQPAAGRLLSERDDLKPGAHPYAVISYDYWTRRFGQDAKVIGRRFRMGNDLYEIAGVVEKDFTGTEPGTFIDVYVPTMMSPSVERSDSSWFRAFAVLKPGARVEPMRSKLHVILRTFQEERARGWTSQSKQFIDRFLNQTLLLEATPTGVSNIQSNYRRSLIVLGALVASVLLIACANVANLLTAQAAARSREMALRVSIGAGRRRLVQMVLVESAWLSALAALLASIFTWWAAPFIVSRIQSVDNPARLFLPADWRILGFGLVLCILVTFLFGMAPAIRVSSTKPANALKGGDPHSRRRLMHALIAVQVAFCFVVHLAAGLFVATFDRLAHQPTGFSAERMLALETITRRDQPPVVWNQAAEHLRSVPGVETVALAGWPLLSGNGWNGFIWVNGDATEVLAYFLGVSPGWTETMKIPFVEGRDLRPTDTYPNVAIVNETFVRQCLGGGAAIGRWFEKETGNGVTRDRFQVIGVVRDARYRNMREPIAPAAYVPFASTRADGAPRPIRFASFLVRTSSANPLAMATVLRAEVGRARPELRVSNIRTQEQLVQQHTVRERLLAMLASFFAVVALLLAGVGLYGVLDYSVLQKRREIGIRKAIGAPSGDIARGVLYEAARMVLVGAAAGFVAGIGATRFIESLLYGIKGSDAGMFALPSLIIAAGSSLAALPAVIRAVRVDAATTLRAE